MPTAWYIAPYKRRDRGDRIGRYCAMDDYTAQILADGGRWTETEILGNRAIVKVRAAVETLLTLDEAFKRLPKDRLDDPLSGLSNVAKTALRNELQDQGYTMAEIQQRFGNDLGGYALRDILRFMASRRRKPRYDTLTDTIILDGKIVIPRSIDEVDLEVE